MVRIIDFLRQNPVEKLTELYNITAKQHSRYPNLYQFKYNQITSPMHEPIVQEARGIILDRDQDWKIIAYPYNKFFNHGEPNAPQVDLNSSMFYEKLDGSLCILYHYDNQWQVATSGTPDAGGNVNGLNMTFAELFWKVWDELEYPLPDWPDAEKITFMFELMTPFNKIVVQHKENDIKIHGARNIETLQELKPINFDDLWSVVQIYPMGWPGCKVEELIAGLDTMNPIEQEGYVVVDSNFNRVKMKCPQYVALHHIASSMSTRRMLDIIRTNENEEFLAYFPEWKDLYRKVKDKYFSLLLETNECYNQHKSIESHKDFALQIKHLPICGALFSMRRDHVKTFEEYYAEIPIRNLESLLHLKEENYGKEAE